MRPSKTEKHSYINQRTNNRKRNQKTKVEQDKGMEERIVTMKKVKERTEERSKPSHEVNEASSTVPKQLGNETRVGGVTLPPGGGTHSQVHTEHYCELDTVANRLMRAYKPSSRQREAEKCQSEVKRGF